MAAPSITGGYTSVYNSGTAVGKVRDIKTDSVWYGDANILAFNGQFQVANGGSDPTGILRTLGSAIDLSQPNTYFSCAFKNLANMPPLSTTTGWGVGFFSPDGDGTYSEAVWAICGKNVADNGQQNTIADPVIINLDATSNSWVVDAGFDPSNITHIAVGTSISPGGGMTGLSSVVASSPDFLVAVPHVLVGGEVGNLASFNDFCDWLDTNWAGRNFHTSPTSAMHYINFVYQIGDGSTATNYLTENQVIQYHNATDMANVENVHQNHVLDNDLGHWVIAASGDSIIHRNVLFTGTQPFKWWSLGAAMSGTVNDSVTVLGAGDVQIANGHGTSGCTFSNCGTITTDAPTITNTVIASPSASVALDIVDPTNVTGLTIRNATTGIRFDFAGSATVDLVNWTLDGCTTDLEYTGTGTLTVNMSSGTQIATTNASGGGTIVLQGEILQQGLTFSGLQSDSQVKIYESGTTTIIDSVESSSGTFSWIIPYVADDVVDYTIIKEGFVPIRQTGVNLSSSVVPVSVQQVADRAYSASSGLIYGSNVVIDTVAKTIAVSSATTVQNLYNALNEFWRDQSALQNVKFPVITNGPNSFTFIDGWELTSGSFPYLSRDGVRYLDTNGNRTAAWAAILTAGNVTGLTAEYQQVEGAAPTDAQNSGVMDQLIQVYGDATHGNFDYSNYLYIKYQANGYDEAGLNVVDQYGQLEDQLYVVAIQPMQMADFTGGDPAITGVTITDHGASPVAWNGKNWSITITDTGGNAGEAIHRWLNYNKSLDATFQTFEPFNLFDMVVDAGSTYETRYGTLIGSAGAATKGVRVVDGSGNPHPFFTRFQADDGSYYTPPQAITLSAPNLTAGRVQLYNVTTATEIENTTITSGYTAGWVDGGDFTAGDTIRLRWTAADKMEIEAFSAAPASGSVSFVNAPVSDDVYVNNGIDGSTITQFSADYTDDEVDLIVPSNFNGVDLYAWWKHNLTTSQGISDFFGGCTALDQANYRFNKNVVSVLLDNTTTTNVIQLDNVRIFLSDETYPVKVPTTGGGGIDVNWRDKVYLTVTGSGALTTAQQAQLAAAANSKYTQAELHTDLDAYTNKADWQGGGSGGLDEAGLHTALDNYTNKNNWKADLTGIATSGDVSAIETTQADLHTWLDAYTNKSNWMADLTGIATATNVSDAATSAADIHTALDSYAGKANYMADLTGLQSTLDSLNTGLTADQNTKLSEIHAFNGLSADAVIVSGDTNKTIAAGDVTMTVTTAGDGTITIARQ